MSQLLIHKLGPDTTMQPFRDLSVAPAAAQPRTAVHAVDSAQCLVVSTDDSRRDNLGFAAREGGWDVTLCGDVASAVTHARQRTLQMTIVDFSGSASAERASFRFLVEQLACTSRMLLLVCGSVDDPREEVWRGIWASGCTCPAQSTAPSLSACASRRAKRSSGCRP